MVNQGGEWNVERSPDDLGVDIEKSNLRSALGDDATFMGNLAEIDLFIEILLVWLEYSDSCDGDGGDLPCR